MPTLTVSLRIVRLCYSLFILIGKIQKNVECDYDFGEPVIDFNRVEQKLDAYKKERGGITK